MVLDVRKKQIDAVVRMLEGNHETGKSTALKPTGNAEVYKVLVLDKFSRDLLAPLMRVNELRKHGVTLHLMLESDRQQIPDVAAVYMMQATQENVQRVVKDLEAGTYESLHVNFTHAAPRAVLEELALGAVKSANSARVAKVFDQYMSFMSLDAGLFSLGLPHSYLDLNDPSAQDHQIERGVSQIVEGLFSVLVTLSTVPIIRCPKGGLASHVAQALTAKLRDHLGQRGNLFTESGPSGLATSMSRPLLMLFDRNFEIATAVQHCWKYQPLVQDVLGLHLNRVDVPVAGEPALAKGGAASAPTKKSYDVGEGDFFWTDNGSKDFPAVAEEVEVQLGKYKKAVEEINRRAESGEDPTVDPDEEMKANTAHLMSAVATLPQLTERKRVLDKHTNIATSLLGQIKTRNIDHFHQLEEDLLSGNVDVNAVMQTIKANKGTIHDKLRLAIVYLLAAETVPGDAELNTMSQALAEAGTATSALSYVRRLRRMNLLGASTMTAGDNSGTSSSQSNLMDFVDKTFGQSVVSQGLSAVTKGVKNFMASVRQSMLTITVEALLEAKPGTEGQFEVYDPKLPARASPAQLQERAKGPFRDSIVFMIGGGNHLECHQLREMAAASPIPRSIMYGATELLSPSEFVSQLAELGGKN